MLVLQIVTQADKQGQTDRQTYSQAHRPTVYLSVSPVDKIEIMSMCT